jgi:hypothetical protein
MALFIKFINCNQSKEYINKSKNEVEKPLSEFYINKHIIIYSDIN